MHKVFASVMSVSECQSLSRVRLFVIPWTVAHQASLSIEFFRQENWSGQSFPSPGNLPNSGIKPRSPTLQADSLLTELQGLVKKIIKYVLLDVESRKKNETKLYICRNRENCWLPEAEVERKKKKNLETMTYVGQWKELVLGRCRQR